jgi:hypothetical protein
MGESDTADELRSQLHTLVTRRLTLIPSEILHPVRAQAAIARLDLIPPLSATQTRLAQAHPPADTPRANNTADGAEAAAQGVHSRIFKVRHFFLFALRLDGLASRLHEDRGAPTEALELGRVHLGHLEQGDAEADDDEAEHHGDQGDGGCFQALVQAAASAICLSEARETYMKEVIMTAVVNVQKYTGTTMEVLTDCQLRVAGEDNQHTQFKRLVEVVNSASFSIAIVYLDANRLTRRGV